MTNVSIIALALLVCSPFVAVTQVLAREAVFMKENSSPAYALPTIVLYGDHSTEDHHAPLDRVAVVRQSDMDSLWRELGISTDAWSPLDPFGIQTKDSAEFPMLYAAQGFIAFEREYTAEQLNQLITECERASERVQTETARRAAVIIREVAESERTHHGKLLFRAGMCDPSAITEQQRCPK